MRSWRQGHLRSVRKVILRHYRLAIIVFASLLVWVCCLVVVNRPLTRTDPPTTDSPEGHVAITLWGLPPDLCQTLSNIGLIASGAVFVMAFRETIRRLGKFVNRKKEYISRNGGIGLWFACTFCTFMVTWEYSGYVYKSSADGGSMWWSPLWWGGVALLGFLLPDFTAEHIKKWISISGN